MCTWALLYWLLVPGPGFQSAALGIAPPEKRKEEHRRAEKKEKEQKEKFNGLIQAIFKGGKIKKIAWQDSFYEWSLEQQRDYAMETASAMNQAADIMQNERNELLDLADNLKKQVETLEKALDINKTIMRNNIINSNEVKEKDALVVKKLEDENKRLQLELQKCNAI